MYLHLNSWSGLLLSADPLTSAHANSLARPRASHRLDLHTARKLLPLRIDIHVQLLNTDGLRANDCLSRIFISAPRWLAGH